MTQSELSHTLYLVLHGEMLIIDDPASKDNLQILIPTVEEHIIMAGPWLGESKIKAGTQDLVLRNCATGSDGPAAYPERFIVVSNAPTANRTTPYCTITVPRPDAVLPGALFPVLTGQAVATLGANPGGRIAQQPTSLDLHPVFQYTVPGTDAPYLENGLEQQWPAAQTDAGGAFSLHIFAEEDRAPIAELAPGPNSNHTQDAFHETGALAGIDISINLGAPSGMPTFPEVPGLHASETNMPLVQRVSTLTLLGRQLRTGNETALQWNSDAAIAPFSGSLFNHIPFCFSTGNCPNLVLHGH